MEQLEKVGVVGAANGSKPREVLIHNEDEWLILKSRLLLKLSKQDGNEDVSETLSSQSLSEDQFNLIKSASDNLCAFMTKVCRKKNVRAQLDEMIQLENSNGTPWEISKKVKLIIITDVYRCYKGLGHDFAIDDDEENIGMYLFMSKYLRPDIDISFDTQSYCRSALKDSYVDLLKTSELLNQNSRMSSNEFFLQKVKTASAETSFYISFISLAAFSIPSAYSMASVVTPSAPLIIRATSSFLPSLSSSVTNVFVRPPAVVFRTRY